MPPRKAVQLVVVLALLFAAWLVLHRLPPARGWIVAGAQAAHRAGPRGAIAATVGIYLCTLCLLPIVPLNVAAGWLYGPWGAVLSLLAAVASAATSFSVARRFGGSTAAQALLTRPRARALSSLAAEGGVLTVALIRLSPVLPFTPSNAVLGLTPMRLRDLAVGTLVGMAPGTFLYAWAGSLLPDADAIARGATVRGGLVWLLLAVAAAAVFVLGAAAAKRVRRVARELEAARPR